MDLVKSPIPIELENNIYYFILFNLKINYFINKLYMINIIFIYYK